MKQGRTLQDLAIELDRQNESKRDFIGDTRKFEVVPVNAKKTGEENGHPVFKHTGVQLSIPTNGDSTLFPIERNAHAQISARLSIPKRYYDDMLKEAPELLATNINHWFQNKPDQRMIRTLDGRARAYLSDRYRRLDNFDLANAVLPVLQEADTTIRIESTEVTERRLYIKAIFPQIEGEIKVPNKVGDVVQSGVVISNSEIGQGSLKIEPLLFRLVCLNGMITATALNKYHTGRAIDSAEEGAMEIFRDATMEADDKAFYLKVQDIVRASLNDVAFKKAIEAVEVAAGRIVDIPPVQVIERTADRFGLAEGERQGVLEHLIRGNDMSAWGLTNAITRASQDVESYDRATEMERIGGRVIEMAQTKEWRTFAAA